MEADGVIFLLLLARRDLRPLVASGLVRCKSQSAMKLIEVAGASKGICLALAY